MGPKERPRKRCGDIHFKPVGGGAVRKSTSTRKLSVRKLEDFESIREQFESLMMSAQAEPAAGGAVAPAGPVELGAAIAKLLQDREKPLRLLKTFANVTNISRQMLAGVQSKVNLRSQIKDSDVQLECLFSEWMDCCGKSPEELEEQSDPLRPSLIAAKFDESGDILDKADEAFKHIKEKYPEKQEVIDFLDFIDKPVKERARAGSVESDRSPSVTVALGKGEEYVKAKLPKLKTEIQTRFDTLKKKFDEAKDMSEHQLIRSINSSRISRTSWMMILL